MRYWHFKILMQRNLEPGAELQDFSSFHIGSASDELAYTQRSLHIDMSRDKRFQKICGMCDQQTKGSDQPAHMHRLIRAFASRLNIV